MTTPLTMVRSAGELLQQPAPWGLILASYLVGSIPFGLLIAKRVKGVDLREVGSGNIGTSNAVRAMGRGWGFLVFCLDFLKGFAPVLAARWIVRGDDPGALDLLQVLAGTAAVVGHCYSIYLHFTGGKGVATGSGAIVAVDWRVFVCGGAVWLVTRFATRYAGLASILMGLTIPVAVWFVDRYEHLHRPAFFVGACLLAMLILIRHRSNMQRMLAGTEPHIGDKIDKAARNHG